MVVMNEFQPLSHTPCVAAVKYAIVLWRLHFVSVPNNNRMGSVVLNEVKARNDNKEFIDKVIGCDDSDEDDSETDA